MRATGVLNPQASLLIKVTEESKSQKNKKRTKSSQTPTLAVGRFKFNIRWDTVLIGVITHVCHIILACKKQTAVSHSSKEAEVTSWDSGLRMEGSLALKVMDGCCC